MKKIFTRLVLAIILLIPLSMNIFADTSLLVVRTEDPRSTMRTFYEAMSDYRKGVVSGDEKDKRRIYDAIRCFDLSGFPSLVRTEKGKVAAIFLKEVIDRVIKIEFDLIPKDLKPGDQYYKKWRLKDTEITIFRMTEGPYEDEYLFSPNTVARAKEFYNKVKDDLKYIKGTDGGAAYQDPWYEEYVPSWGKTTYFLVNGWQWILIGFFVAMGVFVKSFVFYFLRLVKIWLQKTKTNWDDRVLKSIKRPLSYLFATAVWYVGLLSLSFEGRPLDIFSIILQSILSFVLIWMAYNLVSVFAYYLNSASKKTNSPLDVHLVPMITRSIRLIIVLFGTLLALQNLGINVMSLVAGVGIGGLALALAAKDTAANLFGSITVLMDKPFKVGDWILINDAEGTVESIGFRTTRIRTFYNSQVSIPNAVVANSNIDNMGRRAYRRIKSVIGIEYGTSPEKIEAFLEGIKNIIKANKYTRKDYFHVVLNEFGASSLDILLYLFLKVPEWSQELVQRQNIMLEIVRLADSLGVEFAFPTQTLHLESMPGKRVPHKKDATTTQLKKTAKDYGEKGKLSKSEGVGIYTPPYRENEIKKVNAETNESDG